VFVAVRVIYSNLNPYIPKCQLVAFFHQRLQTFINFLFQCLSRIYLVSEILLCVGWDVKIYLLTFYHQRLPTFNNNLFEHLLLVLLIG